MKNRQQIQEIPTALRKTLEKARSEFDATARSIRWGDGPVLICGEGECSALARSGSYAFESFPGWPVVAHPPATFQTYALPLLKQRSILLMISAGEDSPESEELARTAKQQGSVVVLLTNSPTSPLVKYAQHVLSVSDGSPTGSPCAIVCLQAALNLFALEAAQALKRPEPHWKQIREEFDQLPEKLEWLFTQLPGLVRSFAAEITKLSSLQIVGGGFYEFPAGRASRGLRQRQDLQVDAIDVAEFMCRPEQTVHPAGAALFLSGSDSKLRKLTHRCAEQWGERGGRVLSLTDGNDRELVERSDLGLLIPALHAVTSSTVALFMLEWVISEVLGMNQPSGEGSPIHVRKQS